MVITNCAACAAPLAHDAPRCVRCKTRYCNSTRQHDHWRRGHGNLCGRIHRGGNAEQYNADKKYKDAVAVAVEACAEDTKGQTCYICLEAVHPRTGEGLVRGCACGDRESVASGNTGVAHVSCLAEQAKILFAEAEENNLDNKVQNARWARWSKCSLCEQEYHGVVSCALGWACWKAYVGRPEACAVRLTAMGQLGNGLYCGNHYAESLSVRESELHMLQRIGAPEYSILIAQGNLANTYYSLGRNEQALRLRRDVYSRRLKLSGEEHESTLVAARNLSVCLHDIQQFQEAKLLMRKLIPVARRLCGEDADLTLMMRQTYAQTLHNDAGATLGDLRESVTTFEDTERIARRVFGCAHPLTVQLGDDLQKTRATLRACETPPASA